MNRLHAAAGGVATSPEARPSHRRGAHVQRAVRFAGFRQRVLGWLSGWAQRARCRRVGEEIMATWAAPRVLAAVPGVHPNELDLRRIRRALESRRRYRYVEPRVLGIACGYRIESPCCSRNVDPQGGVIDIARLEPVPASGQWLLQRRDHPGQTWVAHGVFASLGAALDVLNEDPDRLFWP